MSQFSDRLRRARLAVGLTQDQLGFAVGLSKQAVSEWENNRGYPAFHTWPRLRAALGVKLDDLICGDADAAASAKAAMRISEGKPPEYNSPGDTGHARDARELALLMRYRSFSPKRQAALLEFMKP